MEGADIYQIAKNCRTSVEMIEKHYAAHIKNTLDAAAINVMRPKAAKAAEKAAKSVSSGKSNGAGKSKPSLKSPPAENAVRKQMVRDAGLRVTDVEAVGPIQSDPLGGSPESAPLAGAPSGRRASFDLRSLRKHAIAHHHLKS